MQKVLIVGAVAGGASAAARLRRLDERAQIIMFERGEYISFANCGLPYYIGGIIQKRHRLLLWSPEEMKARFNIDVRINSEVIAIDPLKKTVTVKSASRGIYEESFDKLVLSPGAKPIRPNIPGIESDKIFTLRNIPDTDRLKAYIENNNVKNVTVVGGGFVGVEMAESLAEKGLEVTLVEAAPHILGFLDDTIAAICEQELHDNGVGLILSQTVKFFEEDDGYIRATLASGQTIYSDIVILAIGVTPDTEFLKNSGITLSPTGHIIVDDFMRTNFESIYAAGDAVEVTDFVTKKKTNVPLAGPANKQGRIIADNIAGIKTKYRGSLGTAVIKVCNLTAACTGANEKTLIKNGVSYQTTYLHPHTHSGYYPNASFMTMKLLYSEKERGCILGCQAVGRSGVDKRIDVIATAMRFGGSIYDLAELELTYAPPYSSAKDPVNMAGFIAQNELRGMTENITLKNMALRSASAENNTTTMLVDVRTKKEFEDGHLKGAVNIPVDEIRARLGEFDKEKDIILYCQVGIRGYVANRILAQNGIQAKNLAGGYRSHLQTGFTPENVYRGKPEK